MMQGPHTMSLREALAEVWQAIDDLGNLAALLEPEDQLDDEEVADGLRGREDRYRLEQANLVISTAFDRALGLDGVVDELLSANLIDPQTAEETGLTDRHDELSAAFGDYRPDPGAVVCRGCPCLEQGGYTCCFCGSDHDHTVKKGL